ncbi:unnamed protein product [Diamesa serratosioi]
MSHENKSVNQSIFKWNDDEKELLIDEYEKDIVHFMNKSMPQKVLWRDLAERMKTSPLFPEKKKLLLNSGVCQRRWHLLRSNFKLEYFDNSRTDAEKDELIPKLFYCKLLNLYKNFVTSQVNETIASKNFGSQNVDNYIDMDSSIRALLIKDVAGVKVLMNRIDNSPVKVITSQKQIVMKKIEALPKDDVFIEHFKTRIDPNTPFNRMNSYKTPLHTQKILPKTKLNLEDEDPKPIPSANNKKRNLTIIYPNYETNDLNTCDLSDINHSELSSCYIQNKTESMNVPIELGFSNTSEATKYSDYQYLDNTTIEVANVDLTHDLATSSKKMKIEEPSLHQPPIYRFYYDQQVKDKTPLNDIQKKYDVHKPTQDIPVCYLPKPKHQLPETSDWQFQFMKKYEADMKNLNDKVDRILRQVSQNTSGIDLKTTRLKRQSSKDIIY